MLFGLRFDFRNPDFAGTTMADRYAAALDIVEWADALGCVNIAVSEHHGRTVRVTPRPLTPGGPTILLGGSSEAAARRAARIADGFIPSVPEVWNFYRDEVQRLGRPDPGPSSIGENRVVALAEDPDEGWEQVAPFFLHEPNAYG